MVPSRYLSGNPVGIRENRKGESRGREWAWKTPFVVQQKEGRAIPFFRPFQLRFPEFLGGSRYFDWLPFEDQD